MDVAALAKLLDHKEDWSVTGGRLTKGLKGEVFPTKDINLFPDLLTVITEGRNYEVALSDIKEITQDYESPWTLNLYAEGHSLLLVFMNLPMKKTALEKKEEEDREWHEELLGERNSDFRKRLEDAGVPFGAKLLDVSVTEDNDLTLIFEDDRRITINVESDANCWEGDGTHHYEIETEMTINGVKLKTD